MITPISVLRGLTAVLALLSTNAVAHPQPRQSAQAGNNNELVQPVYRALDLGSVKPQGWLREQLEKSATGLAGNLFYFYRYVKDSKWLGGNSEYSDLHESVPYWFNGLVPLTFGLDDLGLKDQVKSFLDHIIENQQSDGWLGPETTPQTRGLWGRCYIMLGLMFGVDWRTFFVEGTFPEVVYTPRNQAYPWLFTHGVNLAEAIRFPLAIYRTSHDEALKTQTRTAVDLIAKFHTSVAGTIIGDEAITDLNPSKGAELCTSTELMFSLAWVYQYLADNDIADWAELTAFNAFPGKIWPDWWSHQYVQQENQPWARNLTEHPQMWDNVGSYGNVFGLEPNYPCCTVNHPQGYPKFLANSFVGTDDGGIAHVFLSPGKSVYRFGQQ
ncbi:hypothetical protein NUW58_g8161 [Xylaria curta]|uniref:Uncharacterized protein n=1 Tax=Xylaria curta TaxID=42375 RepID=A0ACC1NBA5_9PEZI|nr:hypothetical protein NUW58_g8161 [Xylaria curta]